MTTGQPSDMDAWISFRQIHALGVPRATLSNWKIEGRVRCRLGSDGYHEYLSADIARLVAERSRRPRNSATKLTYAIADRGFTAVKIGRTADLARRLATFQASSPVDLIVIALARCDIERELHKKLRSHRRHGEWFTFNDQVELKIRRAMRMTTEFREIRGEQ